MISRRGFLFGTLTAAAGATVLQATPDEIKAFGKPLLGPVTVAQPDLTEDGDVVSAGEMVYNYKGEVIGVVKEMTASQEMHDVSFGESWQRFAPGLLHVEYRVIGTGPVRLRFR